MAVSENGVFPQIAILIRPIMIYPWDILGISYFQTNSQVPAVPVVPIFFAPSISHCGPSSWKMAQEFFKRWKNMGFRIISLSSRTWDSWDFSDQRAAGRLVENYDGEMDISSLVGFTD
jgi:hypothetical protein